MRIKEGFEQVLAAILKEATGTYSIGKKMGKAQAQGDGH
jgi:hypothetical protein